MYKFAYRIKIIFNDRGKKYFVNKVVKDLNDVEIIIDDVDYDSMYNIENVEIEAIKYYSKNNLNEKVEKLNQFYNKKLDYFGWDAFVYHYQIWEIE